jgi:hypothetical protein
MSITCSNNYNYHSNKSSSNNNHNNNHNNNSVQMEDDHSGGNIPSSSSTSSTHPNSEYGSVRQNQQHDEQVGEGDVDDEYEPLSSSSTTHSTDKATSTSITMAATATTMATTTTTTAAAEVTSRIRKRKVISRKACESCRKAHACCGDSRPCKRCQMLNLECVDVPSKKRGRKRKFVPKENEALVREQLNVEIAASDRKMMGDDLSPINHPHNLFPRTPPSHNVLVYPQQTDQNYGYQYLHQQQPQQLQVTQEKNVLMQSQHRSNIPNMYLGANLNENYHTRDLGYYSQAPDHQQHPSGHYFKPTVEQRNQDAQIPYMSHGQYPSIRTQTHLSPQRQVEESYPLSHSANPISSSYYHRPYDSFNEAQSSTYYYNMHFSQQRLNNSPPQPPPYEYQYARQQYSPNRPTELDVRLRMLTHWISRSKKEPPIYLQGHEFWEILDKCVQRRCDPFIYSYDAESTLQYDPAWVRHNLTARVQRYAKERLYDLKHQLFSSGKASTSTQQADDTTLPPASTLLNLQVRETISSNRNQMTEEEYVQSILDMTDVGLIVYSILDARVLFWNKSLRELLGFKISDLGTRVKKWMDTLHPLHLPINDTILDKRVYDVKCCRSSHTIEIDAYLAFENVLTKSIVECNSISYGFVKKNYAVMEITLKDMLRGGREPSHLDPLPPPPPLPETHSAPRMERSTPNMSRHENAAHNILPSFHQHFQHEHGDNRAEQSRYQQYKTLREE